MEQSASFQGTLARSLEFGHALEICAKVQKDGSWFSIILVAKSTEGDLKIKVGLQMLVYPKLNEISFHNGYKECQEEINHEFTSTLFYEQFKVNIIMAEENFHIAINNRAYTCVPYGLSLSTLSIVKITGHLEYIKQMDHRKFLPFAWPPLHISDENANFSNDQPMPFTPGHVMVINAQMHGDAHGRFVLQIKNGRDMAREELHISARFDIKKFIRNSKTVRITDKHSGVSYMDYGIQETGGSWPFRDFAPPFNLAIAFTPTEIYIAKDGTFLYRFLYRTKNVLPDLVGVKIRGNDGATVRVNSIDHIQMDDPECFGFENYSKLMK